MSHPVWHLWVDDFPAFPTEGYVIVPWRVIVTTPGFCWQTCCDTAMPFFPFNDVATLTRSRSNKSWESNGTPPLMPTPPRNKALSRDYCLPPLSLNKALLNPYFWGGWHWGGPLRLPLTNQGVSVASRGHPIPPTDSSRVWSLNSLENSHPKDPGMS